MSVGAVDLAILMVYMAGVVALGTWVGRKTRSAADFMVAGRDLPWWLILFSIVATETSTVTFLSIPGFAYSQNLTWLQIPFGFLIGRFAVAYLLLPQYFKGSFFTAYEVLDKRFGGLTKRAASVMFIITRSLADGLRLFLSAIVLQEMTGIPLHWAVTAMGYMGGAVLAFGMILRRLPDGWAQMIEIGEAADKLRILNLDLDWSQPYGLWAGLIGGLFITLGSHGVDQMMVQRYLCARRLSDARKALLVGGFLVVAQFALFLMIGVGLYAFYQLFPPDVAFERPDRVFARFILDEMPVGLLGILLGAIFAAAMSTLSSSLNSCATAFANDLYFPMVGKASSERHNLRVTQVLTILFGLVQIGVGIGGQWVKASVVSSVLGIAGFTTGIVLGIFFLGIFTERVGQRAALAGPPIWLGRGSRCSARRGPSPSAWRPATSGRARAPPPGPDQRPERRRSPRSPRSRGHGGSGTSTSPALHRG